MTTHTRSLKRELGVIGAVMMGLGSIIGTGVFVSIGIAAGVAGPSVVLAILIAAGVATCNGLSSAQLAANHAVSGGTYAYGYRYLNKRIGFTAGWLFLLAKSASAATAALGAGGYLVDNFGWDRGLIVPIGLGLVALLVLIILGGIQRSNYVNIAIVSVTLAVLGLFVLAGLPSVTTANLSPALPSAEEIPSFLQAIALMFVAYTGYGRIATMGEEVRDPRRTIPRAIITALMVTMSLYALVAVVAVGSIGAPALGEATARGAAPLEVAAQSFGTGSITTLISVAAITAMVSVLLNLILGLSRVLLAMGRNGDMPPIVATLNASGSTPGVAVIVMGCVIGGLVLIGDVRSTWAFSAFTVLSYYAITNLCALQLTDSERLFSRFTSWLGLGACLFLAFWVEPQIWLIGLLLIGAGLLWQMIANRVFSAGKHV